MLNDRKSLIWTDGETSDTGLPFLSPQNKFARLFSIRGLKVSVALICGDVLTFFLGITAVNWIFTHFSLGDTLAMGRPIYFVLLIACLFSFGLYRNDVSNSIDRLRRRVLAIATFCGALGVYYSLSGNAWGYFQVIIWHGAVFLLVGFYIEQFVMRVLVKWRLWGLPVLIIGPGKKAVELCNLLNRQMELGLLPVGIMFPPDEIADVQTGSISVPMISSKQELDRLSLFPEVVLLTSEDQRLHLNALYGTDPLARQRASAFVNGSLSFKLPSKRNIQVRCWENSKRKKQSLLYSGVKRAFDLIFSLITGCIALPIISVCYIAIKIAYPGPVFYVQERIGRNGRVISVFKIRSMHLDSEKRLRGHLEANPKARSEWERYFKLRDDPRILGWLGGFIRRCSIDELPQLWNIIRGDMSVVGPRPFPLYHLAIFDVEVQKRRASVLPGLTGFWQISSRSDGDVYLQQAQDLFYVEQQSIWFDFYILLLTVPAVFRGKGAR